MAIKKGHTSKKLAAERLIALKTPKNYFNSRLSYLIKLLKKTEESCELTLPKKKNLLGLKHFIKMYSLNHGFTNHRFLNFWRNLLKRTGSVFFFDGT
jgi:hypothetical protein